MLNIRIIHLPPLLAAVLILTICVFFSGCYSLSQGVTMIGYLNKAVPLENIDDKEFIRLVNDIRAFAMEDLGLAQSRNYTRYVDIDRNYLAAVVSASEKDSFRRHEWGFPVVGRLPYKGFFNIEDARKERAKLEKRGLDVWIRGVDAFSTLGWFRDPLFSYMREYSKDRLADLIIHELVHATVFIKGQINFNEELAQFIGNEGSRLYIETRYGIDSDEYRKMQSSEEDHQKFIAFIQELIAELEELYSTDRNLIGREEILARKEEIIKTSQERFEAAYENNFTSANYRSFSSLPVNNAYLELFRLYYTEDTFYEDLFEKMDRNLPSFIEAAKTITRRGAHPREQLKDAVSKKTQL